MTTVICCKRKKLHKEGVRRKPGKLEEKWFVHLGGGPPKQKPKKATKSLSKQALGGEIRGCSEHLGEPKRGLAKSGKTHGDTVVKMQKEITKDSPRGRGIRLYLSSPKDHASGAREACHGRRRLQD